MYGKLNLNGHSIKNLANPEEEFDCVNKKFLDRNFKRFDDNIQFNSKLEIIGNGNIPCLGSWNSLQYRLSCN